MIIKSDFIWCVYVKWETVCKMRRAKIKIGRPSACVTLKRTCVEQTSICHLSGIWHAYVQLSFKQCIQTCFHRMLVIVYNIGIGNNQFLKEHFTVHKCTMHKWQDPRILVFDVAYWVGIFLRKSHRRHVGNLLSPRYPSHLLNVFQSTDIYMWLSVFVS